MNPVDTIHQQRSRDDVMDSVGRMTTKLGSMLPGVIGASATYEDSGGNIYMVLTLNHGNEIPLSIRILVGDKDIAMVGVEALVVATQQLRDLRRPVDTSELSNNEA